MGDFGWGGDVESEEDSGESATLTDIIADEPESLSVEEIREDLLDVSDTDALKAAYLADSRDDAQDLYAKRLHALDAAVPEGDGEQADLEQATEAASSQDDDNKSAEAESDSESGFNSSEESHDSTSDESPSKGYNGESEAESETSDYADAGDDPFADLAGDSVSREEAADREHKRRVLIWGPEGVGKTHFAYTAQAPIALLDTEGKASDIAEKFPDKQVRIWEPENYRETEEALDQALEWLQAWLDERGQRGTLVVDSMSILWEWAKSHYIRKYYIETPDPKYEDESDVDLKSALETNDPDWPKIKELHNDKLRKPMVQSDFHLVWTAMATEDFGETLEKNLNVTPDKPAGEKDNVFKVNYILHVREDSNGIPHGDLEKSGLTQHTFTGLEWPTWPKLFDSIEELKEAEQATASVDVSAAVSEDVTILKGKPSRLRGVGGGDDE